MGCMVGSLVADAAAMGVHWIYDLDVLQQLEDEVKATASSSTAPSTSVHASSVPLEFLDPPRSPFYAYASGRNSP